MQVFILFFFLSVYVNHRFILDGYPLTMNQIELMTQRKIIPVKVLELRVEEEEVLRRGTVDRHSPSR